MSDRVNSLPLDTIICGDNCDVLGTFPRDCIDLVVTSPPYDDLRTYGGHDWDFYGVAWNLKRLLKPGGVIVWVVNDATVDGSETGSSMRQALHFQTLGLRLHDTMIYHRNGPYPDEARYWPAFEYMFVVSKGKPRAINLIRDKKNATGGTKATRPKLIRQKDGTLPEYNGRERMRKEYGPRENVWRINAGGRISSKDAVAFQHPAIFPERLAADQILSWSNEGDIVLDPFNGSGTTTKKARELGRSWIGIDVNEDYCEIARKRLEQQLLFGPET